MSIGTGIFLFVVGAILTFALEVKLDWIDLDLVGYILMAAGVVIFLIGIIMLITRRSRARSTTVVEDDRI
ncbi:DUF6458 family protein [Microbacterium sp. NPDC087665]|uniref:DUF6458 family protein n=1 Tax=Microbacterium sp. NPDC087665 TaxID=3364194 RepID=UPI00381EC2AD